MPHRFEHADEWAKQFDDPSRDAWQQPDKVIAALKLQPSMTVADVGAGTGYFTVRLARAVPQGQVIATDIEPDMVRYLGERAQREKLANLKPVQAKPADTNLPAPVDLVLLVDVYHHIEAREKYFADLKSKLKPGGRVAIIDFRMDSPEGPPKSARIAPSRVKSEMAKAGYKVAAEHKFLPRQYFLIFQPL